MPINPDFLDVDFTKYPQYVKGYDSFGDTSLFGSYEDSTDLMSDSEIDDAIAEMDRLNNGGDTLVTRIFDQGREGACVADQTAQMHEVTQALQFGKENVTHLSAISLYKRIGRSPSSGAMVSDGMSQARDVGILPLDNSENRQRFGSIVMPNTGFHTPFPANWKPVGLQFRFDEIDIIRTLQGMLTALCRRQGVGVGRQGHSILYVRPMGSKSKGYKAKYANSWRESWGDKGFGYDTLSQMKMSSGWAYTVRSVVRPDHLNK